MNLETKIIIYKFTPQVFTLTRTDTPEFPEDGGAFQQPAGDKSVRRHIPCAVMFGHEGREKPEDDLAENIYRLPFGACIVLHEQVDVRPAVQSDS